ncbi:MAG: energy-coupling factor ABC transporter ATP-binding protein [Roseiflexaceae bacterium]
MQPVFSVRDVVYSYANTATPALDHVSLTIHAGQRVAIMGANGSGKSTLLRILDGLYFPQSGQVDAFGHTLDEHHLLDESFAHTFRRRVAFVFQNPDIQLFNPTVFDEVAFGPLQMRWDKETILKKVAETLDQLEISHLRDRAPHRLSGGEKKRVAIASVLVLDPEVILLDEPTAALDPRSQSRVVDFLVEWGNGKKTVIVATHDLDTLSEIADDAYIFQNGKIVAHDTPQALLANQQLLRDANLIHEHVHHHDGQVHAHPHIHFGHHHHDAQ